MCQVAIQLSDAAEHLIGGPCKEGRKQQTRLTVERRLYDIGSILSTLNLIQRTYVEGKRQPAFSWNWQWEGKDPRPGTPPSRSEARPSAKAGTPQAVARPLFTSSRSASSPTCEAVGPRTVHVLPQVAFPGLGGNSQLPLDRSKSMSLPSFPAVSPFYGQTADFAMLCLPHFLCSKCRDEGLIARSFGSQPAAWQCQPHLWCNDQVEVFKGYAR